MRMRQLPWVLGTLCASSTAAAQGFVPDTHRTQAGAYVGVWAIHADGTVMPAVHFGSIRVPRHEDLAAQFDIELPTAMWFDGPGGETRATVANPTLGIRFAPITGPVAWWIGGRVGAPIASIDESDMQPTDVAAMQSHAYFNQFWWIPEYFPFGLTAGVDVQPIDQLSIFGTAEASFDAPLEDFLDFEVFIQNRVGMEARHGGSGIGGGFAFQGVWLATRGDGPLPGDPDDFQVSQDVWFAYTHRVFFLRLGNILSIDDPLGLAFDDGVITFYLKLGAFFDGERRR
jgi:hypothetical protein